MTYLFLLWVLAFIFFKVFEIYKPATQRKHPKNWWLIFIIINVISAILLSFFHSIWLKPDLDDEHILRDILIFYSVYSFINYWAHRLKHDPRFWRIHELHHSPDFMQVEISMFRHPIETTLNLVLLLILSVFLKVSFTLAISALLIEGCLEILHHSNIRTPRFLRPIRFIIQLPEMHLLHHQNGLHDYNYSPIAFWDYLFFTHRVPNEWLFSQDLGLKKWGEWRTLFFWTKK